MSWVSAQGDFHMMVGGGGGGVLRVNRKSLNEPAQRKQSPTAVPDMNRLWFMPAQPYHRQVS